MQFANLGVGGIIAGLMFFFYRKDMLRAADLWKGQSDALTLIVKENTASNVRLISLIEEFRLELGVHRAKRPPASDA